MSTDTNPGNAPAPVTPAKTRRLGRGLASLMASTRTAAPASPDLPAAAPAAPPDSPAQYVPVRPQPQPVQVAVAPDRSPLELPIDAIGPNPYQPRRTFLDADLADLASSIRRDGVLQPLLVVPQLDGKPGAYTLIAGERRLRASRLAGKATVPCIVKSATIEQMLEWALVENIQRSDLNPLERALAYRDFMDRFHATQQEVADRLGQPRSTVANYLRILDLCDVAQKLVVDGTLSFGHAKVLATVAGQEALQIALAKKVAEGGLSVRHLEQLVAASLGKPMQEPKKDRPAPAGKSQHILDLERQISRSIGTKVVIRPARPKNTGRILIEYYNLDDFDRILESLGATLES